MKIKIRGITLLVAVQLFTFVALLFTSLCYADDLASQEKALKVIKDFADDLCKTVPLAGGSETTELSGGAKAELAGVIKKVADLGIEGAAKYQSTEYQGVLQADLAKLIKNNTNCRLEVWKDLQDKMIGPVSSQKKKERQIAHPRGTSEKTTPAIIQKTEAPNSANVLGNNNQVNINPEVNPNAPVVTYDFNGMKRTVESATGTIRLQEETPQTEAYKTIVKFHNSHDWISLRDISEQELKKTPEWLTPSLFASVAYINMGEIDKAIERLEYVQKKAAGRQDYADANRLRERIREQYGR